MVYLGLSTIIIVSIGVLTWIVYNLGKSQSDTAERKEDTKSQSDTAERKEDTKRYKNSIKPDLDVKISYMNNEQGPMVKVINNGPGNAKKLDISIGEYKLYVGNKILEQFSKTEDYQSGRIYAHTHKNVIQQLKNKNIKVKIACKDMDGNSYFGVWKDGNPERVDGDSHTFKFP